MEDAYNRTIDYLRVSVTDRCNLRCVYCMPPDGVAWLPHAEILSFEEILRICEVMAGLGVRKVKVTGGEPLVRKGAVPFIRKLKALRGIEQVTLTSNGILLDTYLDELAIAGLDALNISLDTLDAGNYGRITRENDLERGLDKALWAIDRCVALGLPVKVNCVPVRQLNDGELVRIASLARDKNIFVRFIELMPIGCGEAFQPVPGDEIRRALEAEFGRLTPYPGKPGNGPAVYYAVEGFRGGIGFISAVSHEFCQSCNRLRLTSDGLLKPCLFGCGALNVKALLREGASNADIERAVLELVAAKPLRKRLPREGGANARESREMFRIGG